MTAGYGQYCPLAMASEVLCGRWTLLVIRELLDGSTSFNDISRGLPLMSRTTLVQRLRELESAGLILHTSGGPGSSGNYRLTEAGQALVSVVRAMSSWGQEWIDEKASLKNIDVRFLMWDMRRNFRPIADLPTPFTVQFVFTDAPSDLREHWLVYENSDVDICYIDPGRDIDVRLETDLRTMTSVWMGWHDLDKALRDETIRVTGSRNHVANLRNWLGLSGLAHIPKRPHEARVLRPETFRR